ncbi:MAG: ATP synthase F1 subunit gamma [Acidobacteriota bacterium]|nr:ATP synthase F1 subunit gamma [Acidobacteriota bacterium]
MPSLLDLRRRIRAVKSTQQITKAMKMVSASKLRRAQERLVSARPFATEMLRVLNGLAARVEPDAHPLLENRAASTGPTLLIVITADRGLAGSFNANVVKGANNFIAKDNPADGVALGLVGRKGREFFVRRGFDVRYEAINIFMKLEYAEAKKIADAAIEEFTSGRVSSVYLVYNEFKSIMTQRVVLERLLPIPKLEIEAAPEKNGQQIDYLFEPGPEQILGSLLPRHVETQIWRALLESAASEHAARMTAMDAATRNSSEILDSLTLYMNKVRQAAITREIIEVVSGAEAL